MLWFHRVPLGREPTIDSGSSIDSPRRGITLVEVVVVIGIIAVLAAISIPAVQAVRGRASRIQCVNHLKQISLGYLNYESQYRYLPIGNNGQPPLSVYPFLEAYVVPMEGSAGVGRPEGENILVSPLLACPVDASNVELATGQVSYFISHGTGFSGRPGGGYNGVGNEPAHGRQVSEIVDGGSQTAMLSERLSFRPDVFTLPEAKISADPRRYPWNTARYVVGVGRERDFLPVCLNERTTQIPPIGELSWEAYTHVLAPNAFPCANGPEWGIVPIDSGGRVNSANYSLLPASSLHSGGVNVALVDGSVRFVTNGIDLVVWGALGTIAGGETTTALE